MNMFFYAENNLINKKYNERVIFIEGLSDQEYFENYHQIIIESGNNLTICDNNKKYNYMSLKLLPNLSYNVYYKNRLYKTITHKSLDMKLGYISGNINVVNCGIDSKFYINCFRCSDNFFVGRYEIINNNYFIDNLDVNEKYNIILVDEEKIVEQKVLSYRTPIEKNKTNFEICETYNLSCYYTNKLLYFYWNTSSNYYDYFRLVYKGVNNNTYEILENFLYDNMKTTFISNPKEGYYQIETIFDNNISKSNEILFGINDIILRNNNNIILEQ